MAHPAGRQLRPARPRRPAGRGCHASAELPPPTNPAPCRLERDGIAQDGSAWQRGFARLHDDFKGSTDQLLLAFERTSGATAAQLDIEPSLMAGQAGPRWG